MPKKPKKLNPTQAIIPALLKLLPKASYYVYLDNLFTSNQLLEYLQKEGFAATSTCRKLSGVIQDIVTLKNTREKGQNVMPWGTTVAIPIESNHVVHTGF
jgi:hypothetical protein